MAGLQRVHGADMWYWLQGVTHDLLLPPESHGWTTGGLVVCTMMISMLVYDVIAFLVELVSVGSGEQGGVTTTIIGGRRRGRRPPRLTSPAHLRSHWSAEATHRVLSAIEDGRHAVTGGRRLQRLDDTSGARL